MTEPPYEPEEEAELRASPVRSTLPLLLAGAGVTGMLAFALRFFFAALGVAGAMYWAVAIAVGGGVVMRRRLFDEASRLQTMLFMGATIAGAVGGLRLARALLLL